MVGHGGMLALYFVVSLFRRTRSCTAEAGHSWNLNPPPCVGFRAQPSSSSSPSSPPRHGLLASVAGTRQRTLLGTAFMLVLAAHRSRRSGRVPCDRSSQPGRTYSSPHQSPSPACALLCWLSLHLLPASSPAPSIQIVATCSSSSSMPSPISFHAATRTPSITCHGMHRSPMGRFSGCPSSFPILLAIDLRS